LTQDIAQLGKAGQVVAVKPGFARNFLVRFGKAVYMGDGLFRKHLPVLHRVDVSEALTVTPRMIQDEIQKWLSFHPMVCLLLVVECFYGCRVFKNTWIPSRLSLWPPKVPSTLPTTMNQNRQSSSRSCWVYGDARLRVGQQIVIVPLMRLQLILECGKCRHCVCVNSVKVISIYR
jgi:hypothetical protein